MKKSEELVLLTPPQSCSASEQEVQAAAAARAPDRLLVPVGVMDEEPALRVEDEEGED